MAFQIGNWELDDDGFVNWKGEGEYFFPAKELGQVGVGERSNVSDTIVHVSEKTWISRQDMEDLKALAQRVFNDGTVVPDPAMDWQATEEMVEKILRSDGK